MTFLRTAGVLLISSSAPAFAAKSKTAQQSGAKQRPPQHDSTHKSFAASVSDRLQHGEDELLGVAQAMPEDKYSFIPTAGKFDDVRGFREQIKHVACAQVAFSMNSRARNRPQIEKRRPRSGENQRRTDQISPQLVRIFEPRTSNSYRAKRT